MKLIPIPAVLISLIFNSFTYAKEIPQTSIPGIRNEILQIQGLKNAKDLGTFGLILDEMFFWFSDNVEVNKYIFEENTPTVENSKISHSGIVIILLRDKNGALKKAIYNNEYLSPLEKRSITLDFGDGHLTSVKIKFTTFYGNIEKNIILQFKKGESHSVKDIDNVIYWGKVDVAWLRREFSGIENKIIQQNFINRKEGNFGSLGKIMDSFFEFEKRMKSRDIFVVYSQRIKNAPLQEMRADCFFIASNLSLLVLYDSRLGISAVYKISRLNKVLKFESISFTGSGIQVANVRYNSDNFKLQKTEMYLIPFAKTEPEVLTE